MFSNKKLILIWSIAGLLVVAILITGYFYFLKPKEDVVQVGAVGAAEEASGAVPQIPTNPGEKVPEINPLDRVNPFKYNNPLR